MAAGADNTENEARRKTLKYAAGTFLGLMLIASWYSTQSVAAACGYDPLLGFSLWHIYAPWMYFVWTNNAEISSAIPNIIASQEKWFYLSALLSLITGYALNRSFKVKVSYGSASWATKDDIDESGLGSYEYKDEKIKFLGLVPMTRKIRQIKNSGVVVGINPYTNKLMLHDGPEHILLMAPTRSGKGVNTIIPTGLIWAHSIFFFDVKSELWQATASYRRKMLHQNVLKFEPLCSDGSTARWNPLAEIDFQTTREINDVSTIVDIMVKPDGEKSGGSDPFWDNSAATLLKGVILHLLYSHYQEKKPLPSPTDMMSFLSSPDKDIEELFTDMKKYPHITPEDFLSDRNILQEIYGEYVRDFRAINKSIAKWGVRTVRTISELRDTLRQHKGKVEWAKPPFCFLLIHPKVAECAANMLNGAEQTRASIMQTAQTALALYQNPVVQKNTSVSDFCIRDLLDPRQAVSVYLVMQVDDVATLKSLSRLFINTILSKLIRDMKFDVNQSQKGTGKQRLLLMLDEFPQLGNMQKIELALAVCAGYGIKMCIVSQDVNQLNKEYTKDNSIGSNCHVHIYFTPNLDGGGATAKAISESLGKKTISTVSHSDNGGLFGGSDSTSDTGRDLMTPDEVSKMSAEREIVFVAGHRPVYGKKLRYYLQPWFLKRILPAPLYSDTCTTVQSYDDLFRIHEAERKELEQRASAVREAKANLLLDSAKDEKARADIAVEQARAALEELRASIGKDSSPALERRITAAEGQLVIAENARQLAGCHIHVYQSRADLVTFEILVANAKDAQAGARTPEELVSANENLSKAQREYEKAKRDLVMAIRKEQDMNRFIRVYDKRIEAQAKLMATMDRLDTAEKAKSSSSKESEDAARMMFDIAMAAKEAAEHEYREAMRTYDELCGIREYGEDEKSEAAEEKGDATASQDVEADKNPNGDGEVAEETPPHGTREPGEEEITESIRKRRIGPEAREILRAKGLHGALGRRKETETPGIGHMDEMFQMVGEKRGWMKNKLAASRDGEGGYDFLDGDIEVDELDKISAGKLQLRQNGDDRAKYIAALVAETDSAENSKTGSEAG